MHIVSHLVRAVRPSVLLLAFGAVCLPTMVTMMPSSAQAQSSGVIVRGNERVDVDTILTYVTIRGGRAASASEVDESLKALFATGLFQDVKISRSGSQYIVTVVENPTVNGVAFVGNDRLKDEVLIQVVQTQPRGVYTDAQVENDIQRMLEAYRQAGRFNAVITPEVNQLERNRVNIVFNVDEQKKTGIGRINFVGNKAFSDTRLRSVLSTKSSGLLSFISKKDIYNEDKLAADEERLRKFYFEQGYADFSVISSVAELDKDKNKYFISITIDEGERYRFGNVSVDTILTDLDPDKLQRLVQTKKGNVYNSREVERTLEELTIAAADGGYAFAQVTPRGERGVDNTIDVTYAIDQGTKAFIERINIVGNTRTRDYVIRREFDISEGDPFSKVMLDRAERRLRELRFFKSLRVSSRQGSAADRVIVDVVVEDQPTGDLNFGGGVSLAGQFVATVSVTERNFLGRGQFVRAAVGYGQDEQTYDFSFTEPYFLGRRVSAGFDIFRSESDDSTSRSFDLITTGGRIRFGLPLTNNLQLGLRYSYDQEEISDVGANAPAPIAIQAANDGVIATSEVGYTLTYNTLNSRIDPRNGLLLTLKQDFAGLGGDVSYVRSEVSASAYKELSTDLELVGLLNLKGGNITGLGEDVFLTDNFYRGGDIVRGFRSRGIGPRDESGDALGGRNFVAATAEVQFPMFFVPRDFGLKGAIFADAGALWDVDNPAVGGADIEAGSDDFEVRSSIGAGFIWNSPFGPLRGDFAYAINEEDFDRTQIFRIGGSTRF